MNKATESETDRSQLSPATVRRISGMLMFAAMLVGSAWVVWKVSDPHTLPVRVVRIDGESRYLDRLLLESVVADATRRGFFNIDVMRVRQVAEKLPWVDSVSVRRVWPDTVVLNVTEQEPLGRWASADLVSTQGVLFRPRQESIPKGLPQLSGPPGSAAEVAESYKRIAAMLDPLGLGVARVELDARRAWTLRLSNGVELRLGKADQEERLQRFVHIYPRLAMQGKGRMCTVDLRYTNGVAVSWEAETDESQDQELG
jgi:cell division protein FtsQ